MTSRQFFKKIFHDKVLLLIAINVVTLIGLSVTRLVMNVWGMDGDIAFGCMGLPSGVQFLMCPWTPVTYMFTDPDVISCMFNMLWLYWFGRMYEMLTSQRQLLWLYLIGGLGGALAYIVASMSGLIAGGRLLFGASAAVLSIVTTTALIAPNLRLNMMFLGRIALKWVALVSILLFVSGLVGGSTGSQVAHGGGVIAGVVVWIVWRLRRPRYNRMNIKGMNQYDARQRLDYLLDKVRRSGYSSLSRQERQELLDLSNRV